MQRWFERLENFDFEVKYIKGVTLISADALSRGTGEVFEEGEELNQENREKILKIHSDLNHRKTIKNNLEEVGIKISTKHLKSILEECLVCCRKDNKKNKTCNFVEINKPGDRMGIDILELVRGEKVLVAIDYFSRKIFAMSVKSKEAIKVVSFLDKIYEEFPFTTIISDNGREFSNSKVENWMLQKKVNHIFAIPYYHQSNGRVERANRTIRNACRKTKGILKIKLKNIVENYNSIYHRGIGMSPNEALKKENYELVKKHELKYKKEFSKYSKKCEKFKENEFVFIRNEQKKNKMEDEFSEKGKIIKNDYGDVYVVLRKDGKKIRRHATQLRRFLGGGSCGPIKGLVET